MTALIVIPFLRYRENPSFASSSAGWAYVWTGFGTMFIPYGAPGTLGLQRGPATFVAGLNHALLIIDSPCSFNLFGFETGVTSVAVLQSLVEWMPVPCKYVPGNQL